eukprot:PITA_24524
MYRRVVGLALSGLLLVICSEIVHGSIHDYTDDAFLPQGNGFVFYGGSEGLYASLNTDNRTGIDNGKSFIKFDSITLRRTQESASKHDQMEHSTGLIEAVIFETKDRYKISGNPYDGATTLCCTPDLAKLEGCKQGEIIVHRSADEPNWPRSIPFVFQGNNLEAKEQPDTIYITKSGMYNIYFMFCDPHLKGTIINGRTVWKNPTGYLPGRLAPLLKFYGFLSLAYLILGLIWFLQYVRFGDDILQLQNCITAVISLGMLDMTLWYFKYANFNATGRRPMSITT